MTTTKKPATNDGLDRDEEYDSADKFVSALSAASSSWDGDASKWIFRGVPNADWPLKAKPVRDPKAFAEFGIPGAASDWSSRVRMLNRMLATFQQDLDRSGIAVPVPITPVVELDGSSFGSQPPRSKFPLMALAQHHGLPTLLLDWSRVARVAAYFAAAHLWDAEFLALSGEDRGTRLAVWALRLPPPAGPNDDWWSRHLARYDAPASTNPNLRAQSGTFTLLREVDFRLLDPSTSEQGYETLSIQEFVAKATTIEPKNKYVLRRITLPHSQALPLLRLLSHEGVDGVSMFPGADGVVKAMRERALWDRE
jgi:hypothetical protein